LVFGVVANKKTSGVVGLGRILPNNGEKFPVQPGHHKGKAKPVNKWALSVNLKQTPECACADKGMWVNLSFGQECPFPPVPGGQRLQTAAPFKAALKPGQHVFMPSPKIWDTDGKTPDGTGEMIPIPARLTIQVGGKVCIDRTYTLNIGEDPRTGWSTDLPEGVTNSD